MRVLLFCLGLCLSACPTASDDDDESCELGEVRCPSNRVIQECDEDGLWDEPRDCPPREGAGGLLINTVCYSDQGVCAP